MTVLRILVLWGPLAVYMGALLWASSRANLPGAEVLDDKLLHAAAYAVMAALAVRAFLGGLRPLRAGAVAAALLLTIGYGAMDELIQSFVPGRQASLWDLAADALGAALATLVLAGWLGTERRAAGTARPRTDEVS